MSIERRQERVAKGGRILLWEGRVSRSRLIAEYGLSPIGASGSTHTRLTFGVLVRAVTSKARCGDNQMDRE